MSQEVTSASIVGSSRRDRARRLAYSAASLAVVGGVVATLGAPLKWAFVLSF